MARGIGALLLLGCSFYLGACLAAVEKWRVRQYEGFLLFVRHIRNSITCFQTPIEEIYAAFANVALERCGLLPALRAGCNLPAALHRCRDSLYVEAEEWRTLSAFASEVGKSYTQEQARICDYTIKELEAALHRQKEEGPRRARGARALAVCGGLALLILLL